MAGVLRNRGGQGKRTKGERELDLSMCGKWYVQGYTQAEMASQLNSMRAYSLTPGQIAHDLKEIRKRWVAEYMPEYNEMQAKELARLDALEKELWGYWVRSQEEGGMVVEEDIDNVNAGGEGAGKSHIFKQGKKTITKFGRDGDSKFADQILRIVAQRCKILGLNAPQKHQVDWRKEAEQAGISNASEIFEEMVEKFILEEDESDNVTTADEEAAVDAGDDGGSIGGGEDAQESTDN